MRESWIELNHRGLVTQQSAGLDERAERLISTYVGIDPTAPSLHIGHLIPLITAKVLSEFNESSYVIIGGATAEIGDPSGRSKDRPVLSANQIASNSNAITAQIKKLCPQVYTLNNATWIRPTTLLQFARDIASKVLVSELLTKTMVQDRLGNGLTLSELLYSSLQGYDFLHLRRLGIDIQFGGNDQWGNLTAGLDILSKYDLSGHIFTTPLALDMFGNKVGKSTNKSVTLDAHPFTFFQFWLGLDNTSNLMFLRALGIRAKQPDPLLLAYEMTKWIHSPASAVAQEEIATKLSKRDITNLPETNLPIFYTDTYDNLSLVVTVADVSRREARQLLDSGAVDIFKSETGTIVRIGKNRVGLVQ